jgi:hypothetical protein
MLKLNKKWMIVFSAIFLVTKIYANEIYIEQVGSGSTITLKQDGSDNKIGTPSTSVFIGGGSNTVNIEQTGSANELQFIVNGASTDMNINVTGSNNIQSIICGSLQSASCSGSTINQTITGDDNTTTVNLGAGGNHTSLMTITGDLNSVTHSSTNVAATSADITVVGNSNTIGVTQSGTLPNTVVVNSSGNNNNISINQSN